MNKGLHAFFMRAMPLFKVAMCARARDGRALLRFRGTRALRFAGSLRADLHVEALIDIHKLLCVEAQMAATGSVSV